MLQELQWSVRKSSSIYWRPRVPPGLSWVPNEGVYRVEEVGKKSSIAAYHKICSLCGFRTHLTVGYAARHAPPWVPRVAHNIMCFLHVWNIVYVLAEREYRGPLHPEAPWKLSLITGGQGGGGGGSPHEALLTGRAILYRTQPAGHSYVDYNPARGWKRLFRGAAFYTIQKPSTSPFGAFWRCDLWHGTHHPRRTDPTLRK